jgi:hypothetical protein
MDMKGHILAALREVSDRWEDLLSGLSEEQITTPPLPSELSIKDEIAHLWAWQQRSVARTEAARLEREPRYPDWPVEPDREAEDVTDKVNAWIYATHRDRPWPEVHADWREGFLRFLESAQAVSERDLLDRSRYPWLDGHALAAYLLSSYDHHQEHYEKTLARLHQRGDMGFDG